MKLRQLRHHNAAARLCAARLVTGRRRCREAFALDLYATSRRKGFMRRYMEQIEKEKATAT